MGTKRNIIFLLIILVLVGLVLTSCTGVATIPRGWSGGAIADGILFVGSMEGKLVAVNVADGSYPWAPVMLESLPAGGGFGCAPASTAVAIYGSPAISGDVVYVGGYNGMFYAFASGQNVPKWIFPRQGNIGGPIVGGPVVAQDRVYFASGNGKVYALDADGYEKWVFETGDKIWSTPAIDGNTLFIGSFDKKLYALNATDGSKKWTFETEGAIVATPLVDNNTAYIGSFDRYLYAVDAVNGNLKWKFMAGSWFWAKPVIYNNVVYAASLDGKVYALDAGKGDKLADFDLGSPIDSPPVLVGSSVIVTTEKGIIYTLNTGNKQISQLIDLEQKVYAPLAASQGIIYIHTADDALYAVDAQSGAVRKFNIRL